MKKIIAIFMLLLSLVLVACTEPTVYKIEFETNGGQVIESIEFSDTYALSEIDKINPDKAGYSFDGWYLESSLNVDSKLSEDITTSVKLYAKWLAVDYLLTLNLDGGVAHIDQVYTFNI